MQGIDFFIGDETGAVTVDWVALTAGVLLVGIVAVFAIYGGGASALVAEVNALANSHHENIDTGDVANLEQQNR